MLLQHLRAFNTPVKQGAQQHANDREHQAENNAAKNNQRFLRLQHAGLGDGRVDDTHVAHGAGLGDLQLLLFVQQLHVDLLAGLHVTGQAHNLLLGFWHRGNAAIELRFFFFQGLAFFQQGAVRRMTFGVKLGDLCFFKGQLVQLGVDVDHRIQHRLGFQRQVDRVFILAIGVKLVLCLIQAGAHFRELLREEGEAF
ncbi:hypothetical protein D3C75_395030 [compost metagenome]